MGRIKGWKKVKRGMWYNPFINWWLRISTFGGKVGRREYIVSIELPNGNQKGIRGNPFDTFEDARRNAVRYMKKHPRG